MMNFLITSITCQIVLFAIYKLVLESSKMHRFNRFYLLFALAFSVAMPFVTIPVENENVVQVTRPSLLVSMSIEPTEIVVLENSIDYLQLSLWTIYGFGLSLFLVKFIRNLARIAGQILKNRTENGDGVTYVLLDDETLPHTFLNYIFVNADEFEKRTIEAELFTHELAHARQKHSLDILLVEILKIILWFNPTIGLYKKAIRLNHEFLADQAVVSNHDSIPYQELLLSKAHITSQFALASSFNFSVTKKRMIMMTKTISPIRKVAQTLGATLTFAVLFSFFGFEGIAQTLPPPPPPPRDISSVASHYSKTIFHITKADGTKETKRFSELTESQVWNLPPPPPKVARAKIQQKQIETYRNTSQYAVWIDGKHVANDDLKNRKASDFVSQHVSKVHKNARSKKFPQPYQVNLYTANGFSKIQGAPYPQILEWHFEETGKSVLAPTQKKDADEKEWEKVDAILSTTNEPAGFPGGMAKFYEFFNSEFKTPADFKGKERLVVKFMVEADGKIANVEIVKASTDILGREAVRAMQESPNWKPATEAGKPVKSEFHLPIEVNGK
ncbi:M56 family metallopeptidase [Flavobacterium selenitireducens]|uniref:M56 family metallopeptidase n=1 Tax=Flavobacterium selenitireducens TaxID=2722704 RepID=UPI00168BA69C|nr:M56 family metallopeptidase [Flavobacterium selenitireducens]MBD3582029.1 hypothetical protein [Flavobacterium selenitireducens]